MGARLWSDRRGGNRASNPSSPRHAHHTSLTPANFTHSVLYVCEGVRRSSSNSVRVAMDAARDRKTRYQSVQQDTTMGYPIQVPLPDGEEWPYNPPTMRSQTGSEQEAEIYRGCIKPPPNKTIGIDEKGGVPPRSSSIGGLASGSEWGASMYRSNSTGSSSSTGCMQRHSAPLDQRYPLPSSSSSSSSASSVSSSLLLEDERASPRRTRTGGSLAHKGSQIFDKCSRTISSITSPKEGSRGHHHRSSATAGGSVGVGVGGAGGGGLGGMGLGGGGGGGGVGLGMMPGAGRLHESPASAGMRVNSPPRSNTQLLQYHSTSSSALSDITLVQCESAGPNLGHTGIRPPGSPHGLYQPCPPHPGFGPTSHSGAQTHSSPLVDQDSPPLYSEVIENPTQFRSRPSDQRTNSGKI